MKRLQLLLLWVWMVCFSAASHDYMFKHLEVKDGLSNNQVNAIYKDSNGFMWFGTASGLNRYDGYNIKIYRSQKDDEKSLPDSYVEDIQEDTSGNLWIRTGGGYAIYNSASDVFDRNVEAWMWNIGLTGNPSLIYIDKEKTFWIYINGKGVYSYREEQKNAVSHLNRSLNNIGCKRQFDEVFAKDWDKLTDEDFKQLLSCGYHMENYRKPDLTQEKTFQSLYFMNMHLTEKKLQEAAKKLFLDKSCGKIFRIKGFMKNEKEQWIEMNATKKNLVISPIKMGQEVIIVIGEQLDEDAIRSCLEA